MSILRIKSVKTQIQCQNSTTLFPHVTKIVVVSPRDLIVHDRCQTREYKPLNR